MVLQSDIEPSSAQSREETFKFGTPVSQLYHDPAGYDPGENLEAAIRVALLLGLPLLLTGEPGCGKTSVAFWLAWKLHLAGPGCRDEPLVHYVKSTSTGRDLLYEFDELERFRDGQAGRPKPLQSYLRLNALGRAILYSSPRETPILGHTILGGSLSYADLLESDPQQPGSDAELGLGPFQRRHVVLIDELDKAPRDTPNDLLLEIEQMRFRIKELDIWVEGSHENRPIVVITSNSEKSLPEPFLRRCVFHHIRSPDDARRREIVKRRQHPFAARRELFNAAMGFFDLLHGSADRPSELSRPPGTAELLAWLTVLEDKATKELPEAAEVPEGGQQFKRIVRHTLGTLAKTREDFERAEAVLRREGLDL
jgi:MoxR-like ATPase